MPVTAKICGLSTPETLDTALRGGASHVGFVFYPPSPRDLTAERFASLAARVPSHVRKVGIFVDPDAALLNRFAPDLDTLQLHKVTPARAAEIRTRHDREVWAAIAVKTEADLHPAPSFAGAADRLLYDAKTGASLPGGMGMRFDWRLLAGFRHPLPWALSGGLDANIVGDAVRTTGATLIDVSSGVETAPGVKDVDKIAAFLKAVSQL